MLFSKLLLLSLIGCGETEKRATAMTCIRLMEGPAPFFLGKTKIQDRAINFTRMLLRLLVLAVVVVPRLALQNGAARTPPM